MKVLVAGPTGALGRVLVPMLVAAGHDVVGMTRSARNIDALEAMGAKAVIADGLDGGAVKEAVARAEPEVIVHQMTALKTEVNFKKFDQMFALTNRLRTEGTDNLLAAARSSGVRRIVAQSFAGWPLERTGGPTKTEDDPYDPTPVPATRETLKAIQHVESAVTSDPRIEGLALRYGGFYGPGSMVGASGTIIEQIRKRRLPIIGDGAGVWSFIHFNDAAAATVRAVERGAPGIYHIVDDEPAPVAVWLPELAKVLGAKPPRRLPVWLAKLAVGDVGVSMFTKVRGADNTKAKRELDWHLEYPTWREGFRHGL